MQEINECRHRFSKMSNFKLIYLKIEHVCLIWWRRKERKREGTAQSSLQIRPLPTPEQPLSVL